MKKKTVSMLMAMAMAASMMAGSTTVFAENSDPDTWPTVSFTVVPVVEITDEEAVETALNDYLVSINAGVKADPVCIDFGNLSTTLTLMLSSTDEPIDLFSYNFFSNITSVVANEQVIALDEYLEQYPELVETIGADYMKLGQLNGEQYALPVVGSYATKWYYVLRKDIAEEIGVADKDGQRITLEELDKIMEDAKAAHNELAFLPIGFDFVYQQNYDTLGDSDIMGVLPDNGTGSTEIINYYDTDDFVTLCKNAKTYADRGFFLNDPLNQAHDKSFLKTGVAGGSLTNGISHQGVLDDMGSSYAFDCVAFELTDLVSTCTSAGGSGWCISSVSQNPDAAAKMLTLLYTDENVMRFVAQGLEGMHYVVDENGCSWYPEGKGATDLGWGTGAQWYFPNQTLTIPFCTENANVYKDMIESNSAASASAAIGFIFDNAPVYDQYVAVDAVVQQYRDALLYGQVDVDSFIEQFREELNDAGIADVIAEKQAQLDAFLGK